MNNVDVLSKMADIELPAPPDWHLAVIFAATLLIVLVAIPIMWHSSRRIRKHGGAPAIMHSDKVLEEIKTRWSNNRITDREASYQLSTLLRLGLGLPQLNDTCPAGLTEDAATWEKTITLFNQLRYKKNTAVKLSPDDFKNVKKWLMHTAANNRPPC